VRRRRARKRCCRQVAERCPRSGGHQFCCCHTAGDHAVPLERGRGGGARAAPAPSHGLPAARGLPRGPRVARGGGSRGAHAGRRCAGSQRHAACGRGAGACRACAAVLTAGWHPESGGGAPPAGRRRQRQPNSSGRACGSGGCGHSGAAAATSGRAARRSSVSAGRRQRRVRVLPSCPAAEALCHASPFLVPPIFRLSW
jgi:hypothetical protein